MKRVDENVQINKKLIADSAEKEKTKMESQQDLQKSLKENKNWQKNPRYEKSIITSMKT